MKAFFSALVLFAILSSAGVAQASMCYGRACLATITACGLAGYTTEDRVNECISYQRPARIVEACGKVGFTYEVALSACIQIAPSAKVVSTCGRLGYTTAQGVLDCIRAADTGVSED